MTNIDEIKFLIIHCSDTSDDKDLSAADIHKMHLEFGWDGIGYHKVIKRNGIVENGRPEFWKGAHTYGMNNVSLGVCLIGRQKFTKQQFNSLKTTLIKWRSVYINAEILGHCDAISTKKTCPNFNVASFLKESNLL